MHVEQLFGQDLGKPPAEDRFPGPGVVEVGGRADAGMGEASGAIRCSARGLLDLCSEARRDGTGWALRFADGAPRFSDGECDGLRALR